jgi:hypothetical protein
MKQFYDFFVNSLAKNRKIMQRTVAKKQASRLNKPVAVQKGTSDIKLTRGKI